VTQTNIGVGARAPDFAASDQNDEPWQLAKALLRSAQVLVFYRGDW
jgi:peroxiredoxin